MDHSLQGYLGRMSTATLKVALQYCLQNEKDYEYALEEILRILKERNESVDDIAIDKNSFLF